MGGFFVFVFFFTCSALLCILLLWFVSCVEKNISHIQCTISEHRFDGLDHSCHDRHDHTKTPRRPGTESIPAYKELNRLANDGRSCTQSPVIDRAPVAPMFELMLHRSSGSATPDDFLFLAVPRSRPVACLPVSPGCLLACLVNVLIANRVVKDGNTNP